MPSYGVVPALWNEVLRWIGAKSVEYYRSIHPARYLTAPAAVYVQVGADIAIPGALVVILHDIHKAFHRGITESSTCMVSPRI